MNGLEPHDVDVPGVVAMLVLGLGLHDLFLDVLPGVPFSVVFVVGFAVVLPLAGIPFHRRGRGRHERVRRAPANRPRRRA